MRRLLALGLAGVLGLSASLVSGQEQPLQPVQPPPPTIMLPPLEAKRHVVITWTMGDQQWDFREVESTYDPVRGELDMNKLPEYPNFHGKAVWTLRIARDLLEGEVLMHKDVVGSPFKAVLLDADRVPVEYDMQIGFTAITGKKGDALKAAFILPPPEVWKNVRFIRVERRTKVGFETPQVPQP
jgi:hypothetical protein